MQSRPMTLEEAKYIIKGIPDKQELFDTIWELEKDCWREKPVDIWTFLYHPDYLGNLFNDNGKSGIYPFWMRLMDRLYPSPFYTAFNEVLLSTSIGIGKSTITCSCIASYEIYKLLCLKNPATYYGLLANSVIVTALFSSTMDLVVDVNWPKMRDAMITSPWFRKRLNLSETQPKIKSLDLDKNVAVQIGSRTQHAISRDVLIAIVDEGNNGVLNDQVKENYNEIYRRRKSRFEKGFRVPGLLLACSSPKGEDDFINSRIKREEGNPDVLVIDNVAEWDVKDKDYCGKKIWIFMGDDRQDGHVLAKDESTDAYDRQLLLRAPIEVKSEFEKDFIGALRDIAGRRTVASTTLFKERTKIYEAFKYDNIFTKDVIELDVRATLEDIKPFLSYTNMQKMLQRKYNRFIGIDFGLNGDKFGFAMGYGKYPDNYEESDRKYIDKHYVIEAVTSFKAKTKAGVPSAAVRQLIRYFRALGFPIQLITADKPGQVMLQDLLRDFFEVEYLSVDTSRIPYHVLRDQVSLQTITGPDSPLLRWEICHLVDDGHKCLTGDTKLWTKEYGYIAIEDLANKGTDNEFTVLSKDEQGNTIEAKAYNARQTKIAKELIELEFDNGKTVRCTPDHRVLLKNGMYKEAQYLTEQDELADDRN